MGQWKVGITTDLDKRLQTLRVGNPNITGIQTYHEISDKSVAYMVETMIKKSLKQYRVKGEWFSQESLNIDIFKYLCEKYELNANIHKQIQDNINNDKNNTFR